MTFAPALPSVSRIVWVGQAHSRPSMGCCPRCGAGVYSCPCGETKNFMCACFPPEPLYCGCANEITPGAAVDAGQSYIDVAGVDGHLADLVGAWDTDDDAGGESMPHLTMLSDAYVDPLSAAVFAKACTSFGKQLPPYPTPGNKNRLPIRESLPIPLRTLSTSAPTISQRLAISFI